MSLFGVQLNTQLNKLIFDIRINLTKNKYIPNIRKLYRAFALYDSQLTGLINSFSFEKALNTDGIFMKKYYFQVFQKAYNQNGKLNWFSFLSHLKQPMGLNRKELVEKIFDNLDTNRQGKINTQLLSNLLDQFSVSLQFQLNRILSIWKKSQTEIQIQFLSLLHIQNGFLTKEEFVNFYNDLNINFGRNDIFARFVCSQWYYTPQKVEQVKEQQIKKYLLALRNKLLEKTQGSKNELQILKLFKGFDVNGNSYLGAYDLDVMMKKLGVNVKSCLVELILTKIDKNKSGYIQFEQFKMFLYHHSYPY